MSYRTPLAPGGRDSVGTSVIHYVQLLISRSCYCMGSGFEPNLSLIILTLELFYREKFKWFDFKE